MGWGGGGHVRQILWDIDNGASFCWFALGGDFFDEEGAGEERGGDFGCPAPMAHMGTEELPQTRRRLRKEQKQAKKVPSPLRPQVPKSPQNPVRVCNSIVLSSCQTCQSPRTALCRFDSYMPLPSKVVAQSSPVFLRHPDVPPRKGKKISDHKKKK